MWFTAAHSLVCSLIKCSLRLLFSEEALFLVLDKLQNKVPEFAVLYCEEVGNNKLTDMLRRCSGVLGTGLPGLGTEHLPGALCSGTGSPALGLCSP